MTKKEYLEAAIDLYEGALSVADDPLVYESLMQDLLDKQHQLESLSE